MNFWRISDGWFANIFAMVALGFSGYSFYQTTWRSPSIGVFVPPVITYSDPSNGVFDAFSVPVTMANSGARAGVVVNAALEATDPRTGEVKRYYASNFGDWRAAFQGEAEPFAPITIAGKAAETRTLLFYPRAGETVDRLVKVEGGSYDFRLTLETVVIERLPLFEEDTPELASMTLEFSRQLEGVDYRAFNEGGSLQMYSEDFQSTSGG